MKLFDINEESNMIKAEFEKNRIQNSAGTHVQP